MSANHKPTESSDTTKHAEYWLNFAAASISLLAVVVVSGFFLDDGDTPILVASMGASAALLFALPHSRLSQPYPFVAGHLVSVLVGVTCARYIPDQAIAVALAVGLALICMQYLRCFHPPGGAAAVIAVVGGESIHSLGYYFVLMPVGLNVLLMLLMAILLNRLIPRRRYPT